MSAKVDLPGKTSEGNRSQSGKGFLKWQTLPKVVTYSKMSEFKIEFPVFLVLDWFLS